jgi:hypothetical protein
MKTRTIASALFVAAAAALAAGCSETPQDAALTAGKYQGKPDTHPWDGEAQVFAGAEFKRGDKGSWEAALKSRSQAQNEYVRIQQ